MFDVTIDGVAAFEMTALKYYSHSILLSLIRLTVNTTGVSDRRMDIKSTFHRVSRITLSTTSSQ